MFLIKLIHRGNYCTLCYISYPPFLLLVCYQTINPSPRSYEMFRSIVRFYGCTSPRAHTQAGGPSFFVCPPLFIQYIPSYAVYVYVKAVPPSATWRRAVLCWQRPTYHGFFISVKTKLISVDFNVDGLHPVWALLCLRLRFEFMKPSASPEYLFFKNSVHNIGYLLLTFYCHS